MAKNKRWGNYEDNRDHNKYHKELLKRYEIYLDLDWVNDWKDELISMNKGKKGMPYTYPKSMITYQALLVEKFSTRGAEAITRKLEEKFLVPKCNDHSTIHRRILKLELNFVRPKGVFICEATDGSGFKMTNSGEYFQDKYGVSRRKFAKVVITATKDEILEVDVNTYEKGAPTEPEIAMEHIKSLLEEGVLIDKSFNDGGFDTKEFFRFLDDNKIKPVIRIRANASTRAKGCLPRKIEVLKFKKLGFKDWSKQNQYGQRWPMTESHFSAIKRCYGDCTKAKKVKNIFTELRRKVWIYNYVKKHGIT